MVLANYSGDQSLTFNCGRFYLDRVGGNGKLTFQINGRTALFVGGDVNLGSGLTINLGPSGELDLFIKGGLTDVLEYQMMSRLADDLLKTLEVYLDSGGNATRAAKRLFLHRNTLRQRIDRIAALLDVDLTTSERWLSLHLAVKAARLARLAPAPVDADEHHHHGGGDADQAGDDERLQVAAEIGAHQAGEIGGR